MNYVLSFLFGVIVCYTYFKITGMVGKRAIGSTGKIGSQATKQMLAELDHTRLLRLNSNIQSEINRRKVDTVT